MSIACNLIVHCEAILDVGEIKVIVQSQSVICGVKIGDPDWAVNVLEFEKSCVWSAIRIDQTVHAEVAIVYDFPVVASICVHILVVCRLALVYSVVAPLPHKAAACGIVAVKELEIVLQITGTVAHGMAVFAQDVRFVAVAIYIFSHFR